MTTTGRYYEATRFVSVCVCLWGRLVQPWSFELNLARDGQYDYYAKWSKWTWTILTAEKPENGWPRTNMAETCELMQIANALSIRSASMSPFSRFLMISLKSCPATSSGPMVLDGFGLCLLWFEYGHGNVYWSKLGTSCKPGAGLHLHIFASFWT